MQNGSTGERGRAMASMNKPLGSFVAADTPLARVDARVKLLLLLALTVLVFAADRLWVIACIYAFFGPCYAPVAYESARDSVHG